MGYAYCISYKHISVNINPTNPKSIKVHPLVLPDFGRIEIKS